MGVWWNVVDVHCVALLVVHQNFLKNGWWSCSEMHTSSFSCYPPAADMIVEMGIACIYLDVFHVVHPSR